MQSKQGKEETKEAYQKPRLRTIELAAEEVLGVGCKLDTGGFDVGVTPCTGNLCGVAGS